MDAVDTAEGDTAVGIAVDTVVVTVAVTVAAIAVVTAADTVAIAAVTALLTTAVTTAVVGIPMRTAGILPRWRHTVHTQLRTMEAEIMAARTMEPGITMVTRITRSP